MRKARLPLVVAALAAAAAVVACSGSPEGEASCTQSGGQALRVCAGGPTLKGVDVSVYQGTVDWAKAKQAGLTFGIARVSDGLTHEDSTFDENWKGMKAHGVIRGVYQFFRPAEDPVAQANLFLQKLAASGPIAAGDLPPIMDIEVVDGVSNDTLHANMKAWLDKMEQATGRKPLIYTAQFMSANIGSGFGAYPLWVANYGATCPSMPDGWSQWTMWQDSDNGNVGGISGGVDTDVFNGTLADLLALTHAAPAGGDAGAHDGGAAHDGGSPHDAAAPLPPGADAGATIGSGHPAPPPAADASPCR